MGGAGAWSIASADPARWSCVVPVCGRGKTEMAKGLKPLPTWVLVGDMDRDDTVRNAREMVQALKDAGGMVKSTEYRSVGHNSWDRAYNDPALIGWMLEQTRKKP
jgi:predicted peptidase